MINTIYIGSYQFPSDYGMLWEGSYSSDSSLSYDQLDTDTLAFTVNYKGKDDLYNIPYYTTVYWYQDEYLKGKYFLEETTRLSKELWQFNCISAIGLLENSRHMGGFYNGQTAAQIIEEIIDGSIQYQCRQLFDRIKLYGWLPVASKRENLKQVLFATGAVIKKNNEGDPYFTILENNVPTEITDDRLINGSVTRKQKATKVEITEHQFNKIFDVDYEKIAEGELTGSNFTTPQGHTVRNATLVKFSQPFHSVQFEGTELLNDEITCNYCVVKQSLNAKITGKPYVHSEHIIIRENDDVPINNGEYVVSVTDAYLVSLANSGSVGERVLAYYGHANEVDQEFWQEQEDTNSRVEFNNPWLEKSVGYIQHVEGDMGSNENYVQAKIITDYIPSTIHASHNLVSISVEKVPTSVFEQGQEFDPRGVIVKATYDDQETQYVANFTYSPDRPLLKTDKTITISYREMGITKTTTIPITVKELLKQIQVTKYPRTIYANNEPFAPEGMEITAYYSGGVSKIVTGWTYSPSICTTGQTEVEISYQEEGISAITYLPIAVDSTMKPVNIEITKMPDKTRYMKGELFDSTGMEVTVEFDNGFVLERARGWTFSPAIAASTETISYQANGTTVTATITLTIVELSEIKITQPPTKTDYYEDEYFDPSGMEVTAIYSDQTEQVITSYSYPTEMLLYQQTSVTISYTEQGITKTASIPITVDYYKYDYTKSIILSTNQTTTLQNLGATHRNIRVVCIQGGQGGSNGTAGEAGTGSDSVSVTTSSASSQSSYPGSGGQGGQGGSGGQGGKVYYQDIHLPQLNTQFTVSIGSGGSAGNYGTDSTFTQGTTSISSASGNSSTTGYTELFTGKTYATYGTAGQAGYQGGNGGQYNAAGSSGQSSGSYSGGSGGTTYSLVDQGSATINYSSVQDRTWTDKLTVGSKHTGYTSYSFDSSTGKYSFSGSTSVTIASGMSSKTLYENSGGYTSMTKRIYEEWSSGSYRDRATLYKSTANKGSYYSKYYGGGGGSGATAHSSGNSAVQSSEESCKNGANGVAGYSPSQQTIYGKGGDGGSGGSGGGGGAAVRVVTKKTASSLTVTANGASGGSGGAGGTGGKGGNGCIIIYYS